MNFAVQKLPRPWTPNCLFGPTISTLEGRLDKTYFAETETENWKHYSKIIFKCVNSIVWPIFNKKVAEKWNLWVRKQCISALFTLKSQQNRLFKKKKVKTQNATQETRIQTAPRSSHWCQKRNYYKNCVTTSHGCLSLLYLLIEIAIRIEGIADVVNKLEGLADFACNGPNLKPLDF